MDELTQAFLTSSLTILGGIIIFAVTKFGEIFCAEPVNHLNKLRGEIGHKLVLHANRFGNSDNLDDELMREASTEIRVLASELRSSVYVIKGYSLFSFFRLIEPKQNVLNASRELIGLSNSITRSDHEVIHKRIDKIEEYLEIKT